jgi:predicted MFS family arabinose efflux permease
MIFQRLLHLYLRSFAGIPRRAWLLSFVVLVNRSGSMALFFMSLYLTTQLHYSIAEAGRMISIYGAGSLAGAFLGGWFSDRFGAARVQLSSLLLGGISFITMAYISHPVYLSLIVFIAALTNESFRPANATAFAEACHPEVRTRGFALNRLAINLGVSIGPAVGGFLALINYKLIFWVDGLTCLFAAALFLILFAREGMLGYSGIKKDTAGGFSSLKDRYFLIILGLTLFTGLLFTQVFNTWPLYLRHAYRLAENNTGLLLALNALLVALFEMPLVHRLEQYFPLKIIAFGCLFLFGGFAILPLGSSFGFAVFTVLIWTIGEMLIFPQLGGFIANRAPERTRGSYMGMYSFTFSLSYIIGPPLGSLIYDFCGAEVLWYGLGLMGLLTWFGFRLMHLRIRKPLV